ncbi:DUF6282 family protein [Mucilaginibacter ximonensis]|uniref:DUF6282 family protein n=1 Tax=Mucilaginibacter ximonensis TaxID=538021 RepID=A0ABW5Y9A3_9SPHI
MFKAGLIFAGCLLSAQLIWAQGRQSANSNPLAGTIDFHCHAGPDVSGRSLSDLDLARLAKKDGMRGIVLKNHYTMTADRAETAMKEVGGIEVFGGIALNRSVGGLNAEAIRRMAAMEGHRGKVVWLPTVDAENNFEHGPGARKFVSVVKDGKPVPEMAEVFQAIAKNDRILETGHSTPAESLILIQAARYAGIGKIIVTHAQLLGATVQQMKQMADMGAYIEFCWQSYLAKTGNKNDGDKKAVAECVKVIQAIGADRCIIDSDLGQPGNPLHPDGMRAFISSLKANGMSEHDIDLIARKNPAKLLGLPTE